MQDKIFMIKNFISMKCVDTVKRMNGVTSKMSSISNIEHAQLREFHELLEDILDDMLENRLEPEHKR